LEIKEFTENGSTVWSGLFQKDVALDMMLYPGRVSTALVRLNDSWLWYDGLSGSIEQDEAFFREDNYSPITNKDMAFLSDLVTFDISDMPTAEKPVMEISGGKADRLHFSGDIIAYSEGMGDTSELDFLTPLTNAVEPPEPGKIFPSQSGGGGTSLPPFYVVREPDPRDPLLVDEIDAIRGAYRPFTEVLNNIPSFVMMAFPNSEGSEDMQLVAFEQSSGKVTEMWQGRMRITGSTGTFELWTLDQLRSASTSNTTSGTVSGVVRSNAMAREGDFVVTTTGSGWPFAGSGRFLVFRR
jgi:hypothetical protein